MTAGHGMHGSGDTMRSAGPDTPPGRPIQHQRRANDPARPYVPPQAAAPEAGPVPGWDVTDELGHFRAWPRPGTINPFFADALSEYASRGTMEPVGVLQVGCLAPLRELGLGGLAERGIRVSVTIADEDTPLTRQVLDATEDAYDDVIVGDLRTIALPRRAFDIVYCAGLLERVSDVELVLDQMTSALKPGGLLMIRMGDRRAASALLDRALPDLARRRLWRDLHPGAPGPFPAVYEKPVSESGICSYAVTRGLVVARHTSEPTLKANPARLSSTVRTACSVISRLTMGRYGDDHDELLYVIRKPQDRFARVT